MRDTMDDGGALQLFDFCIRFRSRAIVTKRGSMKLAGMSQRSVLWALSLVVASCHSAFAEPDWTRIQYPDARQDAAMVYDEARGQVLLFGGRGSGLLLDDTWVWDGAGWSQKTLVTSPAARSRFAMAYDAARQEVVLFGGASGFGDTWVWNGTTWTERFPVTSPTPRRAHAMAYDAAREQIVLFGGVGDGNTGDETWVWDGANWTQLFPATSPPARSDPAMAYDVARERVVLFGGSGNAGQLDDTWTWDGNDWTQLAPTTTPPGRGRHAMAYDAARGEVVLFGGSTVDDRLDDTWIWDGSDWVQQRSPSLSPHARANHAMAFHGASGKVVLFGGLPANGGLSADTWTWDGTSWESPIPVPHSRSAHAMAYDATRGEVVLFGVTGTLPPDTWVWNGFQWTEKFPATSPPGTSFPAMAYDASREEVVLFGGGIGPSELTTRTWIWDGTNWSERFPTTSPPGRIRHAMTYDAARGEVVLFGGSGFGGTLLGDTWVWDGTDWIQKFPATSPSFGREAHGMAYDAARGEVVLFGGRFFGNTSGETWVWDGTTWTERFPAGGPGPRSAHSMVFDDAREQVLLFGGSDGNTNVNDTWSWDGTSWTRLFPNDSPSSRTNTAMAYDSARGHVVLFGGFGVSPSGLADTWIWGEKISTRWTTFQHDSRRSGLSPFVGAQDDTVDWVFDLVDGGIPFPVVGPGGQIHLAFESPINGDFSKMVSLNSDGSAASETELLPGRARTAPTVADDGTVYFFASFQSGVSNHLYAIDPGGSVKWETTLRRNVGSVALDDEGTLYFFDNDPSGGGSCDSHMRALHPDGTMKWDFDLGCVGGLRGPALAPNGDVVVTGQLSSAGRVFMAAHSSSDGVQRWLLFDPFPSGVTFSAPAVSPDGTIYFTAGKTVFAVSSDGQLLWSTSASDSRTGSIPALAPNGTIRVVFHQNSLLQIPPRLASFFQASGTPLWSMDLGEFQSDMSGRPHLAVDAQGMTYVTLNPTGFHCPSPACSGELPVFFAVDDDGNIIWSRTGRICRGVIVDSGKTTYATFFDNVGGNFTSKLYRFSSDVSPPNDPPTAGFTMTSGAQSATEGQMLEVTVPGGELATVHFSADRSEDPDGDPLTFDWRIDGTVESTDSEFDQELAPRAQPYVIGLRVTSDRGLQATASGRIAVLLANNPPVLDTPVCSSTVEAFVGSPISFSVTASDADAGDVVTLSGSSLPTGATMSPALPVSGNPLSTTFSWMPTAGDVGTHVLNFTATDLTGLEASCSVTLDVRRTPVIIIPGIMGTELLRADNHRLIWLDSFSLFTDIFDSFLFDLALEDDGQTPDMRRRCEHNITDCTNNSLRCFPFACVPGGTTMTPGFQVPGFRAYDSLLNFLDSSGYQGGRNLFFFGYDWRLDLIAQTKELRQTIERHTGSATNKVDIIAHSMGGLLTRAYLERYAEDPRIRSIIYLGTPHLGAPRAFSTLLGHTNILRDFNGKFPFLNLNTQTFISHNAAAVYQLLPQFDFVCRRGPCDVQVPDLEPFRTTFEDLVTDTGEQSPLVSKANALFALLRSESLIPRSFMINGTGIRTLFLIDLSDPECPKGRSDPMGDGTVPLKSLRGLNGSTSFFVDGVEHADLPGTGPVQQQILNILTNNEQELAAGISLSPSQAAEGLRWFSCSPIAVQVLNEAGNLTGMDDQGNLLESINGSSHFRFSTSEGGFLDAEEVYTVKFSATDNGLFTLQFDRLMGPEDEVIEFIAYEDIPVSVNTQGQFTLEPTSTVALMSLDVEGDGIIDLFVPSNTALDPIAFPIVLNDVVRSFSLETGMMQSLLAKLNAARRGLGRGNRAAARGQLRAFLNEVRAQRGKLLTAVQADTLTVLAEKALTLL